MTKLVTGIEAIQSGKRFRYFDSNKWFCPNELISGFCPKDFLKSYFVIEQEPREFWLDISKPSCVQIYPIDFSRDEFIKVREIDK